MKFSIVIPTYNRAQLIGNTIQSVLNQTYTNFELIVVDDGSSDNTKEVVNGFNDLRIKYFWKENAERGAARNFGLKQANGEYVFFIDSDDEMLPNHLETLHQFIAKNPEINFFATKYQIQRNKSLSKIKHPNVEQGLHGINIILKGNPFASMVCVKKSNPHLTLNVEDRKYAIMEDWLFLLQNLFNDKIYIINEATLILNDHDKRSMRSNNSVIIAKRLAANQWALENLDLSETQKKTLTAYSYYFCAIHAAIDKDYKNAKAFIQKAIGEVGRKKEFTVFIWKLRIKQTLGI